MHGTPGGQAAHLTLFPPSHASITAYGASLQQAHPSRTYQEDILLRIAHAYMHPLCLHASIGRDDPFLLAQGKKHAGAAHKISGPGTGQAGGLPGADSCATMGSRSGVSHTLMGHRPATSSPAHRPCRGRAAKDELLERSARRLPPCPGPGVPPPNPAPPSRPAPGALPPSL